MYSLHCVANVLLALIKVCGIQLVPIPHLPWHADTDMERLYIHGNIYHIRVAVVGGCRPSVCLLLDSSAQLDVAWSHSSPSLHAGMGMVRWYP